MQIKMGIDDLKFYAVNLSAVGLGLVDFNTALTTVTLVVGLGYSVHKWWLMLKSKGKNTKV
tara:strand:+ start:1049 stop:1231 length:183 start_codon:yes stop_codon:yes gene_type:complete